MRVEILGDSRNLRSAFREAERSTSGFAKGIARAGVFAATGLAGITAGIGVAAFKSIQAAQESNKVSKQTEAAIKSTGGAARVTAKQVGDLATAISNKTGIDDEQIQSSENMLLTFTNVRNAAGRNNDIFTQATGILQDMSVALGVDSSKAAIQLGKALNDPIKGVTALSRVGVTFTQTQKDQIKTLVESGHRMEAQKIILRELGKEFGGSAEAAATPLDKLRVVVGNLQEKIGNALLPIVNQLADMLKAVLPAAAKVISDFITNKLIPAFGKMSDWWHDNHDKAETLAKLLHDKVAPDMKSLADNTSGLVANLGDLKDALSDIHGWTVLLDGAHRTVEEISGAVGVFKAVARAATIFVRTLDVLFTGLGIAWQTVVAGIEDGALAILKMWAGVAHTSDLVFRTNLGKAADAAVANMERARAGTADATAKMREDMRRKMAALQQSMDGVHAPKLKFTAEDHATPVVRQIMREMKSQGFSVTARLVRGGTAQKGMRIPGYGGGDIVPIMAEPGEAIVPKHLVSEMAPWAASKGIPGFQRGGRIWPARVNLEASHAALMDRFPVAFPPHIAGGWKMALEFLNRLGIAFNVISSFRPGARTHASGAVSFHALNRAVDLGGNMPAIFNALSRTNPSELIWSPGSFYISRSGHHPIGQLDPITRADHWSHVHAAYKRGGRVMDQGGFLMPGWNPPIYNGTGRPEPVGEGGVHITVQVGQVIGSDLRKASADLLQGIREDLRRRGKGGTANLL